MEEIVIDEEIIEEIVEESTPGVYRNIANDVGKSLGRMTGTSIKKFHKFCEIQNIPSHPLSSVMFSEELLGKFMHYLTDKHKSWSTARGYFSRFKCHLKRMNIYSASSTFITEVNRKGLGVFKVKSRELSVPIQEGASPMRIQDLIFICDTLIIESKWEERYIY